MSVEPNGAQEAPDLTVADLNMLDPALEDAGKSEEDLWNEAEEVEATAPPSDSSDPDDLVSQDDDLGDKNEPPVAAKAAQEVQQPDIWANATPEQKAAYEAALAEKERAAQQLRSDKGRQAALQRRIAELQKTIARPASKPASERKDPREALSAIKDDFPEIAQALDGVVESLGQDVNNLSQAEQRRVDAAQEELGEIIQAETATVLGIHPDGFDAINKNSDAFRNWIVDQPFRVRQAAERNWSAVTDAAGLIEVLDGFKAHLGIKPAASAAAQPQPGANTASIEPPSTELNDRRKRQLAGTAAPQRTGGRPVRSDIPDYGDEEEIWEAMEAMEQAQRRT